MSLDWLSGLQRVNSREFVATIGVIMLALMKIVRQHAHRLSAGCKGKVKVVRTLACRTQDFVLCMHCDSTASPCVLQ
jgi:hypothetical protein